MLLHPLRNALAVVYAQIIQDQVYLPPTGRPYDRLQKLDQPLRIDRLRAEKKVELPLAADPRA